MSGEETTSAEVLLQARQGRLAILTLNRPDRLNALSPELHQALATALRECAHDREVGAVVLTGAGRAFCAGGDMGARLDVKVAGPPPIIEDSADDLLHHGEAAALLHGMAKPTIALINGSAAGAGLALALACDLRIAGEGAVLTTAYAKVALSGDFAISYHLTQIVGSAKARELMFLSEKLSAEEALKIGLLNRIVTKPDLMTEGLILADKLAHGPAVALRYMKQAINLAEQASFTILLEREAYNMARCARTEDAREAAAAFREKRPAVFKGR